jgi:hypothetical protein
MGLPLAFVPSSGDEHGVIRRFVVDRSAGTGMAQRVFVTEPL